LKRTAWGFLGLVLAFGAGLSSGCAASVAGPESWPEDRGSRHSGRAAERLESGKSGRFFGGLLEVRRPDPSRVAKALHEALRGFQDRYRRSYPDRQAMGKLDFTGLEVRISEPRCGPGPRALAPGHAKRATLEACSLWFFQRLPEGWRVIHDHTSVVPGS